MTTERLRSTNGHTILVDEEDAPVVSRFEWHGQTVGANRLYFTARVWGDRRVYLQQLVLGNPPEGHSCLFIDDDPGNAMKSNLAWVWPNIIRHRTIRPKRTPDAPPFRGVANDRLGARWIAKIGCDGRSVPLGRYPTAELAARAYDAAARRLFGPWAKVNFPEPDDPPLPAIGCCPVPEILARTDGREIIVDPANLPILSRHSWRLEEGLVMTTIGKIDVPLDALILGLPPTFARKGVCHLNRNPRDFRAVNLAWEQVPATELHRRTSKKSLEEGALVGVRIRPWGSVEASIKVARQNIYLGTFKTVEEAARARDKAARDAYGPSAVLNFPNDPSEKEP